MHADQRPDPLQSPAVQAEGQPSLLEPPPGIPLGDPGAFVPELHGSRTVIPLGNDAFEAAVLQRMVLHLDRQPPVPGLETGALGNRPAPQHAVELQPEIVVQRPRGMLLDEESQAFGAPLGHGSPGLGSPRESPHPMILVQVTVLLHADFGRRRGGLRPPVCTLALRRLMRSPRDASGPAAPCGS